MIDKIKIIVTNKYKNYTDRLFKKYILEQQFDRAVLVHKHLMIKDPAFITNMLNSLLTDNRLDEAAFVEKSFKNIKDKVFEYRQKAGFDLITHMKSIRETKPGHKPSCNCLICQNIYKAQQNRSTYLNTIRIMSAIRKRQEIEEDILTNPHVSEEKRGMILSRFENNIPILYKTQYGRYYGLLSRTARSTKLAFEKHMEHATKLMALLRVPNN